jgi:hypothetical protein
MKYSKTTFAEEKGIEIKTGTLRMILVTGRGPRIAFFGKTGGKNLLFWDDTDISVKDWKLMGGHRVWVTRPDADESEDAYRPDNGPCEVVSDADSLTVLGESDDMLNTRRGMTIRIEDDSKITVDNFVENTGGALYSGGVWALTCTDPNPHRRYGIPIGDGSDWDCFRFVIFKKWGGVHTSPVNDPQLSFTDDMLVITPGGIETKRMIECPRGIMAMDAPDENTTFIKKVHYRSGMKYPLGCNMAVYIGKDNFMVEMESMGPENTLKPGERMHSVETWKLTDRALGLDAPDKLLRQV